MGAGDFWDDQEKAKATVGELKVVKAQVTPLKAVITDFEDAKLAYEMSREAGDDELLGEADAKLYDLQQKMEQVEMQSLLGGKHDHRNCYLSISAGDGGTEANDWADMLLRMYIYFCEKQGWKLEEVSKTFGTEVGIDHVTLYVQGAYAFGYLACERGTHRLARVSPFNSQGKRQTSFATVDVTPEFEELEVEVPEKDLEITAFAVQRAGRAEREQGGVGDPPRAQADGDHGGQLDAPGPVPEQAPGVDAAAGQARADRGGEARGGDHRGRGRQDRAAGVGDADPLLRAL